MKTIFKSVVIWMLLPLFAFAVSAELHTKRLYLQEITSCATPTTSGKNCMFIDSDTNVVSFQDDGGTQRSLIDSFNAQTKAGVFTLSDLPLLKLGLTIEDPGAGTNTISIVSPAAPTTHTVTLPGTVCSSGSVWKDNGSGVMSCANDDAGAGSEPVFDTCVTVTATGAGTFTVPAGVTNLGFHIVGGGGGGGGVNTSTTSCSGGGGAGGVLTEKRYAVKPAMIVKYYNGVAGTAGTGAAGNGGAGGAGESTCFGGVCVRGGTGGNGTNNVAATTASCNGGGGANNATVDSGTSISYTAAFFPGSQFGCYAGGNQVNGAATTTARAGGGAGANGNGVNGANGGEAGDGGVGVELFSLVDGTTSLGFFGGGGGGATCLDSVDDRGDGGSGVGGTGARNATNSPTAGSANTGSGGGGGAININSGNGAAGAAGTIVYCYDAP